LDFAPAYPSPLTTKKADLFGSAFRTGTVILEYRRALYRKSPTRHRADEFLGTISARKWQAQYINI
jgi:hypothetical protein